MKMLLGVWLLAIPAVGAATYEADGRRDPFVSPLHDVGPAPIHSSATRFLIEEATLEGIVRTNGGYLALLRFADGRAYSVQPGERFYDGWLASIDATGLDFMIESERSSRHGANVTRPYRLSFPGSR